MFRGLQRHYEQKDVILQCENDVDSKRDRKHLFLLEALPTGIKTHNMYFKKHSYCNFATFCMFIVFRCLPFSAEKPKESPVLAYVYFCCFVFLVTFLCDTRSFSLENLC